MFNIWMKSVQLGAESARVMWLRSMVIAGGGTKAQAELSLMVTEKAEAAVLAYLKLAKGGSPESVIAGYRRAVRRNARRLRG
jgi:hypothetical protein